MHSCCWAGTLDSGITCFPRTRGRRGEDGERIHTILLVFSLSPLLNSPVLSIYLFICLYNLYIFISKSQLFTNTYYLNYFKLFRRITTIYISRFIFCLSKSFQSYYYFFACLTNAVATTITNTTVLFFLFFSPGRMMFARE